MIRPSDHPPVPLASESSLKSRPAFRIKAVQDVDDIRAAACLFEAYAASLPIELSFQNFADELASLPGKYAPPEGALLLALGPEGGAIGCVALRAAGPERCEMKRLYVSPEGRGLGAGRALAEAIIASAKRAGYAEMVLDTLPSLKEALALYAGLGFVEIGPYYDTPIEHTVFLSLPLA